MALVVVALVVVACSASQPRSASDFNSGYQSVERDYRTQFTALQTEAQGVVGKDLSTQLTVFTKMSDATTRARDGLRGLTPPAKLTALYHRLVTSLSSQQATLGRIRSSARGNDPSGLNSALSDYASSLQDGISLFRQIDDALASKTP